MASELEVGKVKIAATGGELIIDKAEALSGTIRFYKGGAASSYIQYNGTEDLVHYMPSGTGEQQFYTGGSKHLSIDSTGNITQFGGSPEYHFGTTSASHYNWRIACQEAFDSAFEIASGTTSAGSDAASDTYTTRFRVDAATGKATFGAKDSSEMGVTINGSNQKVSQIETVNSYTLTNGSTMEFEAPSAVFSIYVGDGQGALFFSEYQSATVTKLAGSTTFVAGDAGTAIRVFKASGSDATVTVKNSKTSGSAVLKILSLGA